MKKEDFSERSDPSIGYGQRRRWLIGEPHKMLRDTVFDRCTATASAR
jgi:hypothetical protein